METGAMHGRENSLSFQKTHQQRRMKTTIATNIATDNNNHKV